MQTYTIDIRPRRQATIPQAILQQVGVGVGDQLVASVENETVVLKPKKQAFLDALKAIQKAFRESGIPEKKMQDNLKSIRRQIYEERYANKSIP